MCTPRTSWPNKQGRDFPDPLITRRPFFETGTLKGGGTPLVLEGVRAPNNDRTCKGDDYVAPPTYELTVFTAEGEDFYLVTGDGESEPLGNYSVSEVFMISDGELTSFFVYLSGSPDEPPEGFTSYEVEYLIGEGLSYETGYALRKEI